MKTKKNTYSYTYTATILIILFLLTLGSPFLGYLFINSSFIYPRIMAANILWRNNNILCFIFVLSNVSILFFCGQCNSILLSQKWWIFSLKWECVLVALNKTLDIMARIFESVSSYDFKSDERIAHLQKNMRYAKISMWIRISCEFIVFAPLRMTSIRSDWSTFAHHFIWI